ncbi:MAG TPA: ABC-F family ATP-binding cassette domain-containing protein [Nocardioidaceae bacterium]|nr:ABC-F family ATP-binding cassette domain-containing protein [Nocardioidaceae bacterium]
MAAAAVNLVNIERVSKAFGVRPLLSDVSLGLQRGDKVGIVGRNGDGKTTLLRILSGLEPVDSGRVTRTRDLRIGLLEQHDRLEAHLTVGSVVLGDLAEHEWAGDLRLRDVVTHLLGDLDLDRQVEGLSGGELRRVSLARLLLSDVDAMLLDEPTNHLDIEAVAWLAEHLRASPVTLAVVTHDRWFLDAVCTSTWEVHDAVVDSYEGGYAAYVLAKAERLRQAGAEESRRQNLMRKELAWLRRGAPARTSKPKFRIEAANTLIADEPAPRDAVALQQFAMTRLGRDVLDLEHATISRGGRDLIDSATWRLGPGDRVGLVGVNGTGKTSLLSVLAGEAPPDRGRLKVGRTVDLAYLSQSLDEQDGEERVLASVESIRRVVPIGAGRETTASSMLERFGFTGDKLTARIGDLSGGERRRLQLLRLLMREPNVLLLDEPTNDLDIDTLNVVEDFLDRWPGTLIVVSHDRYFLERVCDTTWALLGDGSLAMLPGGVDEYLRRREAAPPARRDTPPPAGGENAEPTSSPAARRAARKDVARLDRQLAKVNARIAALHEQMAAHASDFSRLADLDAELSDASADRDRLELAWLEAAELAET